MKRSKQRILGGLAVAVASLGLAACGSSEETDPAASPPYDHGRHPDNRRGRHERLRAGCNRRPRRSGNARSCRARACDRCA